jgi:uncharacterized protein (DUF1800 family)
MSFSDLVTSRFTFGMRFNDPQPVPSAPAAWFNGQLAAPSADDASVTARLAQVMLPLTTTDATGTATTQSLPLTHLTLTPEQLWAIQAADTSANTALTRRPADEVVAAAWIRGSFSPWQLQEVMTDFWHNHFSVDAYQSNTIAVMWPAYDQVIRAGALGSFRAMLGAVAKSASMMYYLNQAQSVAKQPNENFAREVMELHTLGIARYLGETASAGAEAGGYSDTDVTNAARVLTGWTIADGNKVAADGSKPATGDFIFSPNIHDTGAKTLFGQAFPAGVGQAEGEHLLDILANHPGTAQTVATKLYVHFVQDVPAPGDTLVANMVQSFLLNAGGATQIQQVLQILFNSPEFAASAGQKIKTPLQFLISLLRVSGAEVNPQSNLEWGLSNLGAPLFQWSTPNGMPDIAAAWTGTNDMIRRWSLASQVTAASTKILVDAPTTLFAQIAIGLSSPTSVVTLLAPLMLGSQLSTSTSSALDLYAASSEILGSKGVLGDSTKLLAGVRALVGAMAATPEFQSR